jgi:hypothetical protein
MEFDVQGPALDRAALTGPVRCVLGSTTAEIAVWSHDLLYGGMGVTHGSSAVYRVAGTARDRGETKPWSLVLKILRDPTHSPASGGAAPDGWDREVHAYRSGLLDDLPAELAAPRCYAIEERPGAVWLWLEDVADEAGARWPIARFALAARHFGRLNGMYMTERSLPDAPCSCGGCSRRALRPWRGSGTALRTCAGSPWRGESGRATLLTGRSASGASATACWPFSTACHKPSATATRTAATSSPDVAPPAWTKPSRSIGPMRAWRHSGLNCPR